MCARLFGLSLVSGQGAAAALVSFNERRKQNKTKQSYSRVERKMLFLISLSLSPLFHSAQCLFFSSLHHPSSYCILSIAHCIIIYTCSIFIFKENINIWNMPTRKTKNNKNGKKNKSFLVSPLFISLVFSFRFIAIKRKRQSVASRPFIIIIIIICLVVCLLCVCAVFFLPPLLVYISHNVHCSVFSSLTFIRHRFKPLVRHTVQYIIYIY